MEDPQEQAQSPNEGSEGNIERAIRLMEARNVFAPEVTQAGFGASRRSILVPCASCAFLGGAIGVVALLAIQQGNLAGFHRVAQTSGVANLSSSEDGRAQALVQKLLQDAAAANPKPPVVRKQPEKPLVVPVAHNSNGEVQPSTSLDAEMPRRIQTSGSFAGPIAPLPNIEIAPVRPFVPTPISEPLKPGHRELAQQFVSIARSDPSPKEAGARIAQTAKTLGGRASFFSLPHGEDSSQGVLAFVPAKLLPKFLKTISKDGKDASLTSWPGSAAPDDDLVTGDLRKQLRDLKVQRADLLQTFLDDAPSVKQVDEQIGSVAKALASLGSMRAPKGNCAVRVLFVSN